MTDISWPFALLLMAVLVTIVGSGSGIIVEAMKRRPSPRSEADEKLAEALRQSSEVNAKLLERLSLIDSRLESVEKTLSEIP
ncbi:hypothetical protein [Demequina sp.]|uniref:hypothetical protein n=1 Tax=Demequina sp. TaxID=2050685 RepID=UPI0025BD2690|nr:hypothetical protein [Demequina sp.]